MSLDSALQEVQIIFLDTAPIIYFIENHSIKAAQLQANYNLKLPDALQVATAIFAGCDSFLTNDKKLSRISELQILVISDFIV